MKKYVTIYAIIFSFAGIIFSARAYEASVTVRVLDEAGAPISNAEVRVGFCIEKKPGAGWGSNQKMVTLLTGINGTCSVNADCDGGVDVDARKAGFFASYGTSLHFTNVIANKLQPWNPIVDLRLMKIGQLVAMYAMRFGEGQPKTIPEIGKPVAFDLMKGDWVAPYGKGEVSDFIFKLERQLGGMTKNGYQIFDATFTLGFSNEDDGIQSVYAQPFKGSQLRLPRLAPEDSYMPQLIKRANEHEDASSHENREDQNYFFRIRTVKDDEGDIVSALYGKIHGEIEWQWDGHIRFVYYLNPEPNSRNMEFDTKNNLFKDLSSLEEVRDP